MSSKSAEISFCKTKAFNYLYLFMTSRKNDYIISTIEDFCKDTIVQIDIFNRDMQAKKKKIYEEVARNIYDTVQMITAPRL